MFISCDPPRVLSSCPTTLAFVKVVRSSQQLFDHRKLLSLMTLTCFQPARQGVSCEIVGAINKSAAIIFLNPAHVAAPGHSDIQVIECDPPLALSHRTVYQKVEAKCACEAACKPHTSRVRYIPFSCSKTMSFIQGCIPAWPGSWAEPPATSRSSKLLHRTICELRSPALATMTIKYSRESKSPSKAWDCTLETPLDTKKILFSFVCNGCWYLVPWCVARDGKKTANI